MYYIEGKEMYYPKASQKKIMEIAESLYDGGWRARDRDLLKEYYRLSDDAADIVVAWLKLLE